MYLQYSSACAKEPYRMDTQRNTAFVGVSKPRASTIETDSKVPPAGRDGLSPHARDFNEDSQQIVSW